MSASDDARKQTGTSASYASRRRDGKSAPRLCYAEAVEQPRYLLHEAVGAGGMGVVYRGTLLSSAGERAVAIKQLVERGTLDPKWRARLIAEARLVFRLNHANICQVLDLGEGERGTFVVMELVRGCDLRALIERLNETRQRLDAPLALYVAREVARGLDYAHRFTDVAGAPLGLVHGDVTPQNVLLSVEGEVKLADFGIAHALDEAAPGAGLRAGTPGYTAPELAHGRRDHRVDIYGLGVTLLVALTGQPPEDALQSKSRLHELRPDISPQLSAIVQRATDADPERRYLSAAELDRELSTELARRHPTFTPSQLAEVVRKLAPQRRLERNSHDTLRSMTVVDLQTMADHTSPPPMVARGTETAGHTAAESPWRTRGARAALAAVALVAATSAMVFGLRHAAKSPAAAAPTSAAAKSATASAALPSGGAELPAPSLPLSGAAELPVPEPAAPEAAAPKAAASARPSRPSERHAHANAPSRPSPSRHPTAPPTVAPATTAAALLTVNASPWGAVLVDGREVAPETPLYRRALPAGDHAVAVRFSDGTTSAPKRVHLDPGELRTLGFSK